MFRYYILKIEYVCPMFHFSVIHTALQFQCDSMGDSLMDGRVTNNDFTSLCEPGVLHECGRIE